MYVKACVIFVVVVVVVVFVVVFACCLTYCSVLMRQIRSEASFHLQGSPFFCRGLTVAVACRASSCLWPGHQEHQPAVP